MPKKAGGKKPSQQGDWEYKEVIYFRGKLAEEKFGYPDGVTLVNSYNRGELIGSVKTDSDANPGLNEWSSIETFYENGVIFARITDYDDGRTLLESFSDGIIRTSTMRDDPYNEGMGVYDWTSIETAYDESGVIVSQQTLFDDGRLQTDTYVDGLLAETSIEDKFLFDGGNYDWDEQHFVYNDDGSLAQSETTFDDGDAVQKTYAEGQLVVLSEYDGDNSETWVGQTTTYNNDGSVASMETYDTVGDLPEDFFINLPDTDVFAVG